MVDYFRMDGVPGKLYFRCDRMRATLSTSSCADMWRREDEDNDGTHAACRLCPLGALHAGEVAASMSPLKGTLTCARCHRVAGRLIGGMLCVSCQNRQYEVLKGRNAKGTAPVKHALLQARRIRFMQGGEHRALALRHTVDTDELIVAALRDSRQRVTFGLSIPTPAAVRQARLW